MVAGELQRQLSPKARQSDRRAAITAAASATVRGPAAAAPGPDTVDHILFF